MTGEPTPSRNSIWLGQGRTAQRIAPGDARSHHRALVLHALYRGGGLSRADLSRELGLSRVTISDVVGDLLDDKLVVELGTRPSAKPGKPATMLDVNRQGIEQALDIVKQVMNKLNQ